MRYAPRVYTLVLFITCAFVGYFHTDVNPSETHSRVIVTQQQHIDETNEEVQELLDAEMGSVEECIRAIELYGSAHVAAQHMMAEEETGALSLSMSSCNATNQQETK